MLNKILAIFSLLGMILGGMLVYNNTAYFPMARGAEVEQRVVGIESSMNQKLDRMLVILETKRSN